MKTTRDESGTRLIADRHVAGSRCSKPHTHVHAKTSDSNDCKIIICSERLVWPCRLNNYCLAVPVFERNHISTVLYNIMTADEHI